MGNFSAKAKRAALIALVLMAALGCVYANDAMNPTVTPGYGMATKAFSATSAKYEAMGRAGVALHSDKDAIHVNPANIATDTWSWHIPAASVTIYNVRDILKSQIVQDAVENNMKEDMTGYATDLVGIYGKAGYGEIAKIDARIGFKAPHFELSSDTQINLFTYVPLENKMEMSVIPQVDDVTSLGIGMRLYGGNVSLDLGVTGRFALRAYYSKVDLNTFLNGDEDLMTKLMESNPVVVGYAIPFDVGATLNLPFGFSTGMVYRNINGNYKTMYAESLEALQAKKVVKDAFKLEVPATLDVGVAWAPKMGAWGWIAEPQVAVDVKDVVKVAKSGFDKETLLKSLHAGVELQVLKLAEVRAGLDGGYVTLGAGLDLLHLIHLEAAYGRQLFELGAGEKAVDAFTIRMNIIWER